MISDDTNTVGFNQWFYFQVHNPNHKEILSKFKIVNMSKKITKLIREVGIVAFSSEDYKDYKIDGQCLLPTSKLVHLIKLAKIMTIFLQFIVLGFIKPMI